MVRHVPQTHVVVESRLDRLAFDWAHTGLALLAIGDIGRILSILKLYDLVYILRWWSHRLLPIHGHHILWQVQLRLLPLLVLLPVAVGDLEDLLQSARWLLHLLAFLGD